MLATVHDLARSLVQAAGSIEDARAVLAQIEKDAELETLRAEVLALRQQCAALESENRRVYDLGEPLDLDALDVDDLDSCALGEVLDYNDYPTAAAISDAVAVQALGYGYVDPVLLAGSLSADYDTVARQIDTLCADWCFEQDGSRWLVDDLAALADQVEKISLVKPRWRGGWHVAALDAVRKGGTFYLPNDAPEKWRARVAGWLAHRLRKTAGTVNRENAWLSPAQKGHKTRELNRAEAQARSGGRLYG